MAQRTTTVFRNRSTISEGAQQLNFINDVPLWFPFFVVLGGNGTKGKFALLATAAVRCGPMEKPKGELSPLAAGGGSEQQKGRRRSFPRSNSTPRRASVGGFEVGKLYMEALLLPALCGRAAHERDLHSSVYAVA